MKERPILFSGPMIRAILEGRKTQTRRAVKTSHKSNSDYPTFDVRNGKPVALQYDHNGLKAEWDLQCPHGAVGDRLWVREAFAKVNVLSGCDFNPKTKGLDQDGIRYRATWTKSHSWGWKPSIHMPRWASRITLDITGVRVERLQGISEKDAAAEGVSDGYIDKHGESRFCGYFENFAKLWQSINGPESWSANPWVWVIEFRRVER